MTRNTRLRIAAIGLIGVLGVAAVVLNDPRPLGPTAAPVSQNSAQPGANKSSPSPPHSTAQPIAKRLTSKAAGELRAAIDLARKRREPAKTTTAASDSAPASPPPDLPERFNQDYVRTAVKAIMPLLSECYDRALERRPEIAGTVVVRFTIVGEPSVGGLIGDSVIDPNATSIDDVQMRECVQETMHAIQIDPPEHGRQIEVEYPFAFSP